MRRQLHGNSLPGVDGRMTGRRLENATRPAIERLESRTLLSAIVVGSPTIGSGVVNVTVAPPEDYQIPASVPVFPGVVSGQPVQMFIQPGSLPPATFEIVLVPSTIEVVNPPAQSGPETGGPVQKQEPGSPGSRTMQVIPKADSQFAAPVSVVAAKTAHNLGTSVLITDASVTKAARLDGNEMKAPQALLASLMDSRVMAVLALTLAAANYRKGRRAGAMSKCEASEITE
jgi:hypothetical protein